MDNFSSYLELMAAFNFAYVLAQDFFKDLMIKAIGIAKTIKQDLDSLLYQSERRLTEVKHSDIAKDNHLMPETKPHAEEKWKTLSDDVTNVKNDFKGVLSQISGPTGFSELCFLSGIICIALLLVPSFKNVDMLNLVNQGCLVNNIVIWYVVGSVLIYLASVVIGLNKENKFIAKFGRVYQNYGNAVSLVFGGLIIGGSVLWSMFHAEECVTKCNTSTKNLSYLTIAISPWFHFLFFLLGAIISSRTKFKGIRERLSKAKDRKDEIDTKDVYTMSLLRKGLGIEVGQPEPPKDSAESASDKTTETFSDSKNGLED